MSDLILDIEPTVRHPVLLASFTGWCDAMEVSSRVVGFLRDTLHAGRIGSIRADDYYDLASTRPRVVLLGGVLRSLQYPGTTLYAWRNPKDSGSDLLLLEAAEPNLRWTAYVTAIMELVRQYEVEAVYSFGSLFDGVPHTRPPRVSLAVAQGGFQRTLAHLGLVLIHYEGPSSVHTALLHACRGQRIPAASFWGHVPAYAQLGWNPRVTLALLETVLGLLHLDLDLQDLRDQADQVDALLDRLVESDTDLRQQVDNYEQQYDRETRSEGLPNADAIVSEVEEFLRGSREDGEPGE
jgi:proteasome assembly chaperone (PAC2) family protein